MSREQINKIVRAFSDRVAEDIEAEVDCVLQAVGVTSPIEEIMAYALATMETGFAWERTGELAFVDGLDLPNVTAVAQIVPQFDIGPYHADFAVVVKGPNGKLKYAVECDGHDFHERTKAQAAHDKRRDRYFQKLGWKVLRFTGSEIYKDAVRCAAEVGEQIMEDIYPSKARAA